MKSLKAEVPAFSWSKCSFLNPSNDGSARAVRLKSFSISVAIAGYRSNFPVPDTSLSYLSSANGLSDILAHIPRKRDSQLGSSAYLIGMPEPTNRKGWRPVLRRRDPSFTLISSYLVCSSIRPLPLLSFSLWYHEGFDIGATIEAVRRRAGEGVGSPA